MRLDLIPAAADLGATATARLGEPHPPRLAWVHADLEPRLAGQTAAVITAWAAAGRDPTCTRLPRPAGRRPVGDDRRTRSSRRDEEDRARGWPSGSGVVEGAWGPLVNDRLEPAGMRWTPAGAPGVLDRRAVRLHGHGDP